MCRQVVIIQKKVSSQIDASHFDAVYYYGEKYILCAICLDIIEIYVYSNILGSIACYLAHK